MQRLCRGGEKKKEKRKKERKSRYDEEAGM
jgi:hypothetical protein